MAIFQDTLPKDIGPVRSSRYYYIAWAAEWRAVYAHAGGSPQAKATLAAKGRGQYVYNVDEFRYSGTFHRITTRAAPHNLYTTGAKLRAAGQARGCQGQGLQGGLEVRPGRAARGAAVRRHDHGQVPVQHHRLHVRPQDQHVPALGDRREEADRRGDRRPGSRPRTSSSCG